METITQVVWQHIRDYPDNVVLRVKSASGYKGITWRELGETVRTLSIALIELGIKMGDKAAIFSENRPEWAYADLAILSCGAITIPIYSTSTPKEIEYILKDSGASIIFVSTREMLNKASSATAGTRIRLIISFEDIASPDPLVTNLKLFLSRGRKALNIYGKSFEERLAAIGPNDLASIIYTSGSTSAPKGAMLTHDNFMSNCRSGAKSMKIGPRDRYLSFLPLSHVFERMAGYYMFLSVGATIAYAESRDTIIEDAKAISPTIMCGVPRFFEKIYAKVLNSAISGSFIKKNIFFWAYKVGRACVNRRLRKKRIPLYLALQRFLITGLVARGLKKTFGGNLRYFVSGGAPLSREVAYFFLSFDILILEGYGLTESSPVITVSSPDDYKIGTVGKPIEGVSLKIAPDGEIMAKGPNIMKGYYHQYQETESTVKDGWLYTGDIGHIDKDGFLVITDRKKDIIVTSGGKNVSPSGIETLIKADRYIEDVLIYGDKRKFISALIIPDFENLKKYAAFKGIHYADIKELAANEKIHDFIRRRIEMKEGQTPRFARVKKFIILDEPLTQDHGDLTPTLKIKRKVVTKKYKKLLDRLYEEDID